MMPNSSVDIHCSIKKIENEQLLKDIVERLGEFVKNVKFSDGSILEDFLIEANVLEKLEVILNIPLSPEFNSLSSTIRICWGPTGPYIS
jgi:hypothetical protein